MDSGSGAAASPRDEITVLGLTYSAGILPNTTEWPQGQGPLPPKEWTGRSRRDGEHEPVQTRARALGLPATAWETIIWREESADGRTSR